MPKKTSEQRTILLIALISFAIAIGSLFLGRYSVTSSDVYHYFFGGPVSAGAASAIGKIRLPRILTALIVGASLSASGASYQGVFRNPMVSPDLLGATAGAGFGAAVGILLGCQMLVVQLLSFICGMSAVFLSWLISGRIGKGTNVTLVLILTGMVISALFQALISVVKYLADPYSKLPEITFWLMGGLSDVSMHDLLFVFPPVAVSGIGLMLLRWRLNVLGFGDDEASSLGVNTRRLRLLIIIFATLMTASVVSISGQIGWVGLVIPHFCRILVGPNYKYLIPASLLTGGTYLLLVDNIARNLLQVEIPISILTAMIGAPFFIYLLLHGKKGWC